MRGEKLWLRMQHESVEVEHAVAGLGLVEMKVHVAGNRPGGRVAGSLRRRLRRGLDSAKQCRIADQIDQSNFIF